MKSLFDSINELSVENDFSLSFSYLNITKGWEIIDKLECSDEVKNQLVKYVNYCYNSESPLLKKKRERLENKMNVCAFLEIQVNDFVLDCVQNRNVTLNKYITWYLRESQDRDFAMLISAEDLYFNLLQTARLGVDKVVTAKDERQVEKVMKAFEKNEILAQATAYEKAMKVKSSIETQERQLEKNYEYLHKTVKAEGFELPNNNMDWAKRWVLKNKQQ